MRKTYTNYTIAECDKTLAQHLDAILAGTMTFWQKFTCEKCWSRIQVAEPNKLFELGHCQECNHITDLKRFGCNYSILLTRKPGDIR